MRDWFAALLVVLAAAPVWADPPAELPGDPPLFTGPPQVGVWVLDRGWLLNSPAEPEVDAEVREKLETPVTVEAERMALSQVLDTIGEQAGVQVSVNWPVCDIVGIAPNTPITLSLEDVTASAMLDLVLEQASANCFDHERLSYVVRDGVVSIATRYAHMSVTHTRLYDIRTLVRERFRPVGHVFSEDAFNDTIAFHEWRRGQRRYPFSDSTQIRQYRRQIQQMQKELDELVRREERADREPRGQGGGGGAGLFGDDEFDVPDLGPAYMQWLEDITETIQDNVGNPDEWLDEDSYLREINGLLVVRTTNQNQREVQALLDGMLEAEIEDQASILRDAQVMRLLSRASAMQLEGDFEGALSLAERALLIDPDHGPARAMVRVLRDTMDRIEEHAGPPQG